MALIQMWFHRFTQKLAQYWSHHITWHMASSPSGTPHHDPDFFLSQKENRSIEKGPCGFLQRQIILQKKIWTGNVIAEPVGGAEQQTVVHFMSQPVNCSF